MSEVGLRFFESIGFADAETIGLTFLEYKRSGSTWTYTLLKKEPWRFSDYETFSHALLNITYDYKINYAYEKLPRLEDAHDLFLAWYQNTHFDKASFVILLTNNDTLRFSFTDEEQALDNKHVLNEFRLLLNELSYPFLVESFVIKAKDDDEDFLLSGETKIPFISDEEDEDFSLLISDEEDAKRSLEAHANIKEDLVANYERMIAERKTKANRQFIPVKISDINEKLHDVDFDGVIYSTNTRVTKSGVQYSLGVGNDNTGIAVRFFVNKRGSKNEDILKKLKRGQYVRICGEVRLDSYRSDAQLYVAGSKIEEISAPPLPNDDYSGQKRIELHLHTKMSALDGVASIDEYARIAKHMGHRAIAITDHGVTQAFPEAQKAGLDHDIKIIYGSELYIIDEQIKFVNNPAPIILNNATYVVFDLETTGLSARYNDIIEFGAVRVEHGLITKRLNLLINPGPGKSVPPEIVKITSITNEMLVDKPLLADVLTEILDFIGDDILVSHNAEFDLGFLNVNLKAHGIAPLRNPTIDTLALSRYLFPESRGHRLGVLARNLEVLYDEDKAHRADFDAEVLNSVWQAMLIKLISDEEFLTHANLANLTIKQEAIRHMRPVHATVYVKNKEGLRDLYELVSVAHTKFASELPLTPRELLAKLRSNLLIGSACFNGEVFTTAMRHDEDTLLKVMEFYDFIEIQPYANYDYLIKMGELESEDQLKKVIADIKHAANKLGKPLVATGDVHYALPSQKTARDVYIAAKGLKGVKHPLNPYSRESKPRFENPAQHYRSTEEMFTEMRKFEVFTEEELTDMIINMPHRINDLIAPLRPFTKELYKPSIENVDELLEGLVYETAYKIYGNPLPSLIHDRIQKELTGIISNGYAVIYYLAHKIVKKATDNKFIVGSRGSVGSSVVAYFAKVSEVNPLPPHYYCAKCQYSDFSNETNEPSGYDLPPKTCPTCGAPLKVDGQNIPFETFLGFAADKIPDIDLNFPEDWQKEAHNYTKELFGEHNVFRAGTIGKVQTKTAFGYVYNYLESLDIDRNLYSGETIAYFASQIDEVKRTTGQHPGGIIVIPSEYEVYNFTPVQYPAGNTESDWLTTHFDYNSLHDNLLKLDLLGHKDPVALKMLCDMTGLEFDDIPTNDPATLSLFGSIDALKLKANPLNETTGALGLPEFGTQFVRQILTDAKPRSFNDLVIVSGLSHGTGVWRFNADELIRSGQTDLRGVIGCRDDIMTYLINMNMDQKDAFTIMESVRRGQSIEPTFETRMRQAGVPDFYIESCKKIEYLFPRAHAAAYVIMAVKVAWFKLYYPLEYYATFFTIRGDNFDLKTMISGEAEILKEIKLFEEKRTESALNPRDQNILENLHLTLELLNRGFKVANIDIYKSAAREFIVDKENKQIIPPFIVIKALGEAAGESVVSARAEGEFISIEDLESRTRLNVSNIESLKEIGALDSLPDSNQISLFDFGDY